MDITTTIMCASQHALLATILISQAGAVSFASVRAKPASIKPHASPAHKAFGMAAVVSIVAPQAILVILSTQFVLPATPLV